MNLYFRLTTMFLSLCLFSTSPLSQTALCQSAAKEIPTAAPQDVGMSLKKLQQVNEIMQGYVDDGKMVGGIVIVARKGKVCFFENYGLADQESGRAIKKGLDPAFLFNDQVDHDSGSVDAS